MDRTPEKTRGNQQAAMAEKLTDSFVSRMKGRESTITTSA